MRGHALTKIVLSAFTAVILLLGSGSLSFADRGKLDDIRHAIREKGKHWVAGDTENSLVPEYAEGRRAKLMKPKYTGLEKKVSLSAPATALPVNFDWSTGGSFADAQTYITPVKNQGNCGSCWAFATTAALESYTLIKGGDSTCALGACDLSEQMLLTCSGAGNCQYGGYIDAASTYIRATGLPSESCYAYNPGSTVCAPSSYWESQVHKIDKWAYVAVTSPTVDALKNALAAYGPLVTTMDVYSDFYYYYKSGVYSYTSGNYVGSHAILIVGYEDNSAYPGGGYFRVKNSWGTSWGEAGFFRIAYSELVSVVNFGDWTIAYQAIDTSSLPAAPSGLAANPITSSQMIVTWTDSATTEDGFKIERCEGAGCSSFAQIGTTGANVASYTSSGLKADTSYTYRVRAYNTVGNSAYSNAASGTTQTAPTPPNAPTGLTAAAVSRSQINLAWTDNASNEDGFAIERCTGAVCTKFAQVATVGADVKTFSNRGLKKGTTYTYRIRAYNSGGYSGYSNTAKAMTPR